MTKYILAVLLILALLPAPVAANPLYLPDVQNGRAWFTPAELDAALSDAGYDPAQVAQYTWCELDASAAPPAVLRYAACTLDLTPGNDADALGVVFWWAAPHGPMVWALVTQ